MNLPLVLLPLKCELVSKAFNSAKDSRRAHFSHFNLEDAKHLDPNRENEYYWHVWHPKPHQKNLGQDDSKWDSLFENPKQSFLNILLLAPATHPDVIATYDPKVPSDRSNHLTSLLELLYGTAIQFELDPNIDDNSNLEAVALLGPVALCLEVHYSKYFDALNNLPYDATRNLRTLLDYLCYNYRNSERWKAMQIKMGLMLANPNARMAWYILHSSLLYTWECITKLRKADQRSFCNIYYKDLPSF